VLSHCRGKTLGVRAQFVRTLTCSNYPFSLTPPFMAELRPRHKSGFSPEADFPTGLEILRNGFGLNIYANNISLNMSKNCQENFSFVDAASLTCVLY
jgi:hypothetical protein